MSMLSEKSEIEVLIDKEPESKVDWLKSALSELGWSKVELSRKIGRRQETVSRWKDDVPDYVIAFVKETLMTRWLLNRYVTERMVQ